MGYAIPHHPARNAMLVTATRSLTIKYMHYIYFVKLKKDEEARNSKLAREVASETLNHHGFAGEGGYFSSSKSDWYVVGGRWSGLLQEATLGHEVDFFKEAGKIINPKNPTIGYSDQEVKKHEKALQKLWESLGFKDVNRLARSSYEHYGYADDAMLITPEIIKYLKKEYGNAEIFDADNQEEMLVKNLGKDDIGQWLVVIDYHN
jgi:hypothetical protein